MVKDSFYISTKTSWILNLPSDVAAGNGTTVQEEILAGVSFAVAQGCSVVLVVLPLVASFATFLHLSAALLLLPASVSFAFALDFSVACSLVFA